MFVSILSLGFVALNSKARFALAAFYQRYRFADTGLLTDDELASSLDVPVGECADALDLLLKESMLIASVDPVRKAGRPKRTFRIHENVVLRLELASAISRSAASVAHQEVVEHLITCPHIHSVGPDVEVRRAPTKAMRASAEMPKRDSLLSRSNRLLLAILFGHADGFGVVNALSNADLCRLTGLDSTSIKQRIRKLLELGFIRRHVPGVASPIFAKKLKSSYVLNLNHRQIAPDGDTIGFAVHESLDELASDWRYLGVVWFELARWRCPSISSRPTSSELATPISVLRLFRSAPKHVFERLEFFLSGCVTDLLTLHWEKVGVDNLDAALGVRDLISAFFRKPMKDVAGGSLLDEQEIIDFFWSMTVQQAEECKARLSQFDGLSFSGLGFRLLPSDLELGYACLGVLIEGGGWHVEQNGERAQTKSLPREAACPVALRQKAGLLTTLRRGRSS